MKQTVKKRVSTDCYLFPHSRLSPVGENIPLDELEKSLQETKNKIIAETSTTEEDEAKEA